MGNNIFKKGKIKEKEWQNQSNYFNIILWELDGWSYDGSMTVGELLQYGDLGLGTLDSIDGELIFSMVRLIRQRALEKCQKWLRWSPDMTVPYAAVVPIRRRSFSVSALDERRRAGKAD